MKDCEEGTALCGVKVEIEKWEFYSSGRCPTLKVIKESGIGVVGLHFKCCPLPVDPNISK